jgi:hypothetical protein
MKPAAPARSALAKFRDGKGMTKSDTFCGAQSQISELRQIEDFF